MSAQPYFKHQDTQAPTAVVSTREWAYPTVRCISSPTAHPSSEVWGSALPITRHQPAARGRRGNGREHPTDRFAELQRRMAAVESAARAGKERSLVVVPSRTIESWQESAAVTQAIEERLLCSLLELRDPSVRMTYVSSSPIAPAIIDYYLSLLPRKLRADARRRLSLVALGEATARPLSEKLLERPAVLERIRRTIPDVATCHLVPYNTTPLERDVAVALGVPMYGADPCYAALGSKSGCRELFASAGIPHPAGAEQIHCLEDAVAAIVSIRSARSGARRFVIKLNEGVSGAGNAIVDVCGVPPGAAAEPETIRRRVSALAPEAPGVTARAFFERLAARGGVIEEWIDARDTRSPSVQLQITPLGEVQVLSTHDQILGGPTGQSYLGCRFPAAPSYAPMIGRLGRRIGEQLAGKGVIGRCAIDFVVTRDEPDRWRPFAIELNLRKGGTTHPYETLVHLTGGEYDAETGTFTTPTGQRKHYVATDHLEAPGLTALGREGVLAVARASDVRFDRMARTGAVFHMLSSVEELGRTGFTAIADSADEAEALYQRVTATVLCAADSAAPARTASSPRAMVTRSR